MAAGAYVECCAEAWEELAWRGPMDKYRLHGLQARGTRL
jgi:hypothetical protein